MATQPHPLSYYLTLEYPYTVVPDDGSFFIEYPDLPGCMTQVEDRAAIASAADEIRTLWIEGEYEDGATIPEPVTREYSGKFVTRLPKSLHRDLVEGAKREGMSLNAYVAYLLAERNMAARVSQEIRDLGFSPQTSTGAHTGQEPDELRIIERNDYTGQRTSERLARNNFKMLQWKEATG